MVTIQNDNLNNPFIGEDNCVPHFQPIVSVESRKIVGYEVLGRLFSPEKSQYFSLGAFFHNRNTSFSERVRIDRIIREKAIRYWKETGIQGVNLFFNLMPNILSSLHQEDLLDINRFHLAQLINKYEINKSDVVIEITEDEFNGKQERLISMIELYKANGFRIAVDDVGTGFSNLERIGYIHPDIIKVDIKIMRESLNKNSFRQVLLAVSEMASKLGSELLFEGVETEKELNLAFSMGASLIQGFYFSASCPEFINRETFSAKLQDSIEKYSGLHFMEVVEKNMKSAQLIESILQAVNESSFSHSSVTEKPDEILSALPATVYKAFLLDLNGNQISPTYFRSGEENWNTTYKDIGNNLSWKPYFIRHKAKNYLEKTKWTVTRPQFDIVLQKNYLILYYNLNEKVLLNLFIDYDS